MKIGIVGSGYMGKTHINAYKNCGVNEFFVCDTNLENAQKLANEFNGTAFDDFDKMLDSVKLDAVSICVPTPLHNPLAIKALEKGVAVLCEKPFASSVEAAAEIVEKAKATGTPLMVAHCLRFGKPYVYLKNVIKEGRFGKLLSLNMERHSTMPMWSAGSWLDNMKKSGGAVVDLHVHETDIAVFLFGAPSAVTTVGDYKQCSTLYHYEDIAVSAQSSWRAIKNYPFKSGYDANFEKATVHYDGSNVTVITEDGLNDTVLKEESFSEYMKSEDFYTNEICYFINQLKNGDFKHSPYEESLLSIKTVFSELESVLTKKTVSVNI